MYILTKKYKYEVFKRLIEANEGITIACSKSGIDITQGKEYLIKNSFKVQY